jgi:hypothetical protein
VSRLMASVAIFMMLLSTPLHADDKQVPVVIQHTGYTAIYQAVFRNFPLQATHRLEPAGADWYFSSIASGFFGQIEENSTFSYTETGIAPLHYNYARNVLGQNRERELIYNQKDKIAVGSKGEKKFHVQLNGNELDQGTYALALRDDIARGLTAPCYKVVDEGRIEDYCFTVTGKETIETAIGKMEAFVVERVRKPESPRRTRFWFAPSLDYTIARLEHQEEKGKNAYSLEITYYKRDNIQ